MAADDRSVGPEEALEVSPRRRAAAAQTGEAMDDTAADLQVIARRGAAARRGLRCIASRRSSTTG
jgi:hypothetical protein